jgi:acetyltransferase-like isoleucine patch superfamily enzyme
MSIKGIALPFTKGIRIIRNILLKSVERTLSGMTFDDWKFQYPGQLEIGEWTYGRPTIYIYDKKTRLRIGKFCSIAPGVSFIIGGDHRSDWLTTFPFPVIASDWKEVSGIEGHPASKGDIVVGNDVWIGYGSVIMSGISIGDGVCIGAGSVVVPNASIAPEGMIPPYSMVAGNPARIVRQRFSQDVIEYLLKIKWWDWPLDKIRANVKILCSNDIAKLKEICGD